MPARTSESADLAPAIHGEFKWNRFRPGIGGGLAENGYRDVRAALLTARGRGKLADQLQCDGPRRRRLAHLRFDRNRQQPVSVLP